MIDSLVDAELEAALDAFVPAWIGRDWPLEEPRYVGRDLTWRLDLPADAGDHTANPIPVSAADESESTGDATSRRQR